MGPHRQPRLSASTGRRGRLTARDRDSPSPRSRWNWRGATPRIGSACITSTGIRRGRRALGSRTHRRGGERHPAERRRGWIRRAGSTEARPAPYLAGVAARHGPAGRPRADRRRARPARARRLAPGVPAAGSFRFGLLMTPKTPEFLPGGHEHALLTRWFTRLSGSPDVLTAAEQRHHGRLRHRTGRPAARLRALPHPPGRRPGQPGLGQQRRYAPIPVTAMGSVAQRRRARRHATSGLTSPAGVRDRGRWPPSYRRHARRRFCYGQIAFLILKESTAPADAGISGLHRPRRRRPPVRHTGPRAARPLRPPHERAGRPRRRPRP